MFNSLLGMITVNNLKIFTEFPFLTLNTFTFLGEGTMFEPTREFGNQFLNLLQQIQGLKYGDKELELVKTLYAKRMENKDNSDKKAELDAVSDFLINLEPEKAAGILETL